MKLHSLSFTYYYLYLIGSYIIFLFKHVICIYFQFIVFTVTLLLYLIWFVCSAQLSDLYGICLFLYHKHITFPLVFTLLIYCYIIMGFFLYVILFML